LDAILQKASIQKVSIKEIQGTGLLSPLERQKVVTRGLVTGVVRRGFFIQTPNTEWDGVASDAVYVFSTEYAPEEGDYLEVTGKVVDYVRHDTAKPVTQLHLLDCRQLNKIDGSGRDLQVNSFVLMQDIVPSDPGQLAIWLNSLEYMMVSIPPDQTFIAPSNAHGDYVVALDAENIDQSALRSDHGGVIMDPANPLRWFPGFRITNYNHAPRLNVGAKLLSEVKGPLNFRADSYQISVSLPFEVEDAYIQMLQSDLKPSAGSVTIMTLNCFNLDPHIESESLVQNPRQDIDDDYGEGRFHTLAHAIVLQANLPDIVALQEIQDNDGAEISDTVDASKTYELLIDTIEEVAGHRYQWVDINPEVGADGGQPGGNIRNGFLYNPKRISLVEGSVRSFGGTQEAFLDSRKPLIAHFLEIDSGQSIACINIHLASKRHQNSIFAPEDPCVDTKEGIRISQGQRVAEEICELKKHGSHYYVTGDFNDTEDSNTLLAMLGDHSVNLVNTLPPQDRYDYNHRGKLQVLMHGIVSKEFAQQDKAQYQIIHGNELVGVKPGEESDKPTDHAYVLAKLDLT